MKKGGMREGVGETGMYCRGISAGLQVPPEGPATALCEYMTALHSREGVSRFEARNPVILETKTAGKPSPPIVFFFLPFEVTAHWELSGPV